MGKGPEFCRRCDNLTDKGTCSLKGLNQQQKAEEQSCNWARRSGIRMLMTSNGLKPHGLELGLVHQQRKQTEPTAEKTTNSGLKHFGVIYSLKIIPNPN